MRKDSSNNMNIHQCCLLLAFYISSCKCWADFSECHDDFDTKASDGVLNEGRSGFNWLGFIRYLHVEMNFPHNLLAPRVVLVHRQFVLALAKDVNQPPRKYKLSHIVFGQYERDETECDLKQSQANMGMTCGPAYMEIQHTQIINNPEYSRFGVKNSLSLLKLLQPLKSHYMIPVCLPSFTEREKLRKNKTVIMIDYTSSVPDNFDGEKMGKKTFQLLTNADCARHLRRSKLSQTGVTHYLCSSGCGLRMGAPIITHAANGPFELVGMAIASCKCMDNLMRSRLNKDPPVYIDIYAYVTWITNVVMANIIPNAYPSKVSTSVLETPSSGRRLMASGRLKETLRVREKQKEGWVGKVFKTGNYCYKKKSTQNELAVLYIEHFEVFSGQGQPGRLRVFIRISAGVECTIVCARISLPSRKSKPKVEGIGGYNITIEFTTDWFPIHFFFKIGLMGMNSTKSDLEEFMKERPVPGYWYK